MNSNWRITTMSMQASSLFLAFFSWVCAHALHALLVWAFLDMCGCVCRRAQDHMGISGIAVYATFLGTCYHARFLGIGHEYALLFVRVCVCVCDEGKAHSGYSFFD